MGKDRNLCGYFLYGRWKEIRREIPPQNATRRREVEERFRMRTCRLQRFRSSDLNRGTRELPGDQIKASRHSAEDLRRGATASGEDPRGFYRFSVIRVISLRMSSSTNSSVNGTLAVCGPRVRVELVVILDAPASK